MPWAVARPGSGHDAAHVAGGGVADQARDVEAVELEPPDRPVEAAGEIDIAVEVETARVPVRA